MERGFVFAAGFLCGWAGLALLALAYADRTWINPKIIEAGWGQNDGQLYTVTPADAAPQVRP